MKKIIVFDLDGVLFDSTNHVLNFFLDSYPSLTKRMMDEMLKGNFYEEFEKFKLTNKPVLETEEQRNRRRKEYTDKKSTMPMYDGMKELLQSLHSRGHLLAVNTSALEKNCMPLLTQSGISELFDFVAAKEQSISKTEKFKLIASKYNTLPSKMIFITDTLGDVRESDVANVPTIAVTWGAHDQSFFESEHHANLLKIVDKVSELREYLLNLNT